MARAARPQAARGQALRADGRRPGRGRARWWTCGRRGGAAGGRERPIVIAPPAARRARSPPSVAPRVGGPRRDAALLAAPPPAARATPARTLVMTSGNVSDEPIAYGTRTRSSGSAGIADLFLLHDRPIDTRTDDSVVRSTGAAAPLLMRRSRGYVPGEPRAAGAGARRCSPAAPSSRAPSAWRRASAAWVGPPHRRPEELGDAALLPRRHRALRAPVRGRARGRGARPAPGLPRRPRTRWSARASSTSASSTTTPTWRPASPSTARRGPAVGRDLRRHRLRARRDGLGRRAAGRRPRGLRARRELSGAPARRRPRGREPWRMACAWLWRRSTRSRRCRRRWPAR